MQAGSFRLAQVGDWVLVAAGGGEEGGAGGAGEEENNHPREESGSKNAMNHANFIVDCDPLLFFDKLPKSVGRCCVRVFLPATLFIIVF